MYNNLEWPANSLLCPGYTSPLNQQVYKKEVIYYTDTVSMEKAVLESLIEDITLIECSFQCNRFLIIDLIKRIV